MTNFPYVSLTRQRSLSIEFDNIANNIANTSTTGFRRGELFFSEYVNALDGEPSISQARVGGSVIDSAQGELLHTGGALDLAIVGGGYFGVLTPSGTLLTRSGAFMTNEEGALTTKDGYPVAGAGGGQIILPGPAASVSIALNGSVTADGEEVGQIAVYRSDDTELVRASDTMFRTRTAPVESDEKDIRQGHLESSNADPVRELSRLIEVQRAFELGEQLLEEDEQRMSQAIETLSGAR